MLRRSLPQPAAIQVDDDGVMFAEGALRLDATAFERLVTAGTVEADEQAVELYRGDLLEGLAVSEAPFEEWLIAERERLRELAVEALARPPRAALT